MIDWSGKIKRLQRLELLIFDIPYSWRENCSYSIRCSDSQVKLVQSHIPVKSRTGAQLARLLVKGEMCWHRASRAQAQSVEQSTKGTTILIRGRHLGEKRRGAGHGRSKDIKQPMRPKALKKASHQCNQQVTETTYKRKPTCVIIIIYELRGSLLSQ